MVRRTVIGSKQLWRAICELLVVGFRHRRFVPTLLEDPHGRSLYYTVVNGTRQTTATREAGADVGFSSVTTSALRSDAWRSAAKIEPGASVK
jgi:hypothetical protein